MGKKIGELMNHKAKMLNTFDAFDKVRALKRNGLPPGLSTGWPKFDVYFKFPPMGQLNVITGTPGSGKSEFIDSLCINMVRIHGWKVFMYSPENFPPEYHLQKLAEKYTGKPMFGTRAGYGSMSDEDVNAFEKVVNANISFVDCHVNNASVDEILNSIFLECMQKKVDMAVIDPWNKLESQMPAGKSKTEFIGEALTRIQMFSRQQGISFWIVAHPAKPQRLRDGSMTKPSLYSISDSANWFNMVDNGFIIHRTWSEKTIGSNICEVRIAKIKDRRYGKCGEHHMEFIPCTGHFQEIVENGVNCDSRQHNPPQRW